MLRPGRSTEAELMDGDDYSPEEFAQTLRHLARINVLTRGYQPTLAALDRVVAMGGVPADRPLSVLDIGSGYGDTLRAVAAWSHRRGVRVALTGVDLNPLCNALAEAATTKADGITYRTCNVFDLGDTCYDVVLTALFMHHLTDAEVVRVLRWMRQHARVAAFINDLHRHPLAYHFIRLTTPLFSGNRLICHDAPVSVARSFTRADWIRLLTAADVPAGTADIRWHWAFRFGVFIDTRVPVTGHAEPA
jgi:2-polyprenyl-3-methyl-5-hydroxy-6-metoxy-1,4-benzoquinol methylase